MPPVKQIIFGGLIVTHQRPLSLLLFLMGWSLFSASAINAAPVIDNPAEPSGGAKTIQLEEMWRIGGEDDEETLLGVVNRVLADDQDNVYLLDIQLTEVLVYDADGEYLQSLGSPGEGPGEIRRAAGVLFMPDGTVGLVQGFPGKIVKVDREGIPAGEFRPGGDDPSAGGFFALRGAASNGGRMVFSGSRITRGEDSRTAVNFIASFDEDGSQQSLFHHTTSVRQFRGEDFSEKKEFFPHEEGWALGDDGRVYVAPNRNSYEIMVYAPDGTLERTIKRPYQSYKRTDKEKKKAEDGLMPWRRRNRSRFNFVVEPTEQDIVRMRVTDDGHLWVLPSRGLRNQPEGVHTTWDVFDNTGQYEQTVALKCEGVGLRDKLFFAGDDMVVLVKQYADAMMAFQGQSREESEAQDEEIEALPLEVICYRIIQ